MAQEEYAPSIEGGFGGDERGENSRRRWKQYNISHIKNVLFKRTKGLTKMNLEMSMKGI